MSAKEAARKALNKVKPGKPLTRQPGPRVLIEDPGYYSGFTHGSGDGYIKGAYDPTLLAERLRATVPTVAVASSLQDYNLNEWDCLVTNTAPLEFDSREESGYHHDEDPRSLHSWAQRYPKHLSIICVVSAGGFALLDALPAEAKDVPHLPSVVVVRDPENVGQHITQVDGLPDRLSSLVNRELLPVARSRHKHPSFRRTATEGNQIPLEEALSIRPFLLGPDNIALAGSYERHEHASVWLLPADLVDFYPWVIEALREWQFLYPERFPVVPDWHDSAGWRSAAEAAIDEQRRQLTDTFKAQYEDYKRQLAALDEQAQVARTAADAYQRALLSADGDALSEAVACALAALGFHVVDMDQHWPEGDRREDLRVFDEADSDWVALVEVKGANKGAKETEVQNFGRWAERFIFDEKRLPSARWFVTNHQRGLDPSAREQPFQNKSAVVTTFARSDGTVIDSRALFDLVRLIEHHPELRGPARSLLKAKPPVLVRVTVDDLATTRPTTGPEAEA